MTRFLLVFFAVIGALTTAAAEAPPQQPNKDEVIRALLERLDRLEKKVAELESRPSATTSPAPAVAAAEPTSMASTGEKAVTPPSRADIHKDVPPADTHYPSIHFRGFGDVDFSATDTPTAIKGFNLGQFSLHIASPLSKKISYFGEISFSARPNTFNVELERSFIRYDYDDRLKVSFGRFHTAVNYWNTAFHHGLWLQTTISRPDMIQFGGTLLPVHFVGLQAEGSIPSGPLGLGYNVGVGNGRGSIISRGGDAGDINSHRAWLANIYARPGRFSGLQVGGSIYRDKVTPASGAEFREWISSVHFIWERETPEVMAEFSNVRHRSLSGLQTFNSQAYYAQVAYRLPWQRKRWKPYYRFDHIHTPAGEAVLGNLNLKRSTAGMRFDITDYAAFKGEFRSTVRPGLEDSKGFFLQTSFTF